MFDPPLAAWIAIHTELVESCDALVQRRPSVRRFTGARIPYRWLLLPGTQSQPAQVDPPLELHPGSAGTAEATPAGATTAPADNAMTANTRITRIFTTTPL